MIFQVLANLRVLYRLPKSKAHFGVFYIQTEPEVLMVKRKDILLLLLLLLLQNL